jgi:hypothetical protein
VLHVTNGDCTADLMARAGVEGDLMPWRDSLWSGRIPAPGGPRDERLARALGREDVVLWFEHDLYDQLQLLQVLSFVDDPGDVQAIVVGEFLGSMSPQALAALWPRRRALREDELATARETWAAFTAPDPTTLESVDASALEFLPAALRRLLEEYPGVRDGLSRNERQILEAVRDGATDPIALFHATQSREEAVFAGDRQIWDIAEELAGGAQPLLRDRELTAAGEAVLDGRADAVGLRGIDRWIGGVHLHDDAVWRWNASAGELRPPR